VNRRRLTHFTRHFFGGVADGLRGDVGGLGFGGGAAGVEENFLEWVERESVEDGGRDTSW